MVGGIIGGILLIGVFFWIVGEGFKQWEWTDMMIEFLFRPAVALVVIVILAIISAFIFE